tara:strand:+ start:1287 stop:1688 length:402 start_codon:yes stop_codon:yes gene_type:complete
MNIRKFFKKRKCNTEECVLDGILEKAKDVDEARELLNSLKYTRIKLLEVLESVEKSINEAEGELNEAVTEFNKIKIDGEETYIPTKMDLLVKLKGMRQQLLWDVEYNIPTRVMDLHENIVKLEREIEEDNKIN